MSGVKYFLRNTKTNKKFEIIKRNKEAGTVTLKGDLATWDEMFDMNQFKKNGYVLEKEEVEEDA